MHRWSLVPAWSRALDTILWLTCANTEQDPWKTSLKNCQRTTRRMTLQADFGICPVKCVMGVLRHDYRGWLFSISTPLVWNLWCENLLPWKHQCSPNLFYLKIYLYSFQKRTPVKALLISTGFHLVPVVSSDRKAERFFQTSQAEKKKQTEVRKKIAILSHMFGVVDGRRWI